MAKTVTVIDSHGGKREVTDSPENLALAKENGFTVDRGLIDQGLDFIKGANEGSIVGRVTKAAVDSTLDAVGYDRANKVKEIDHTGKITVVDSHGGRREVTDSPENRSLAESNGFQVESLDQTKAGDILARPEYQGARGAGHVFQKKVESEYLFGVPEMAQKHSMAEPDKLAWDKLKEDNATASYAGSGVGIVGNMLTPGLNLGGTAAKAEKVAVKAAELFGVNLTEKAAVKAGEEVALEATSLGGKMLLGAGKQMAAGAVYSAPHAAGQIFFEDPVKAGESIGFGIGVGAVLGGAGPLLGKFGSFVRPMAVEAMSSSGVNGESRLMKTLGAERGSLKKIGEENEEKIGRILLDAGVNSPGISQKTLIQNVEALNKSSGETIGKIREELDAHVLNAGREANASRKFIPSINPDAGLEKVAGKGEKVIGESIRANPAVDLAEKGASYPPVIGKFGSAAEQLDGKVSLYQSGGREIESEAAPLFEKGFGLTEKALGNEAVDKGQKAFSVAREAMPAVEAATLGFNPKNVIENINNNLLPKFEGPLFSSERKHLIKAVEHIMGDATGQPFKFSTPEALTAALDGLKPMTLAEGAQIKKTIAKGFDLGAAIAPTEKKLLSKQVYKFVSKELDDATTRLAEHSGNPEMVTAYKTAASQYWATSTVKEKMIPNLLAKEKGNRFFSPSDHSAGFMGLLTGLSHGGPAGIAVAGASYAGKRILESTPFQSTVTAGLDKASQAMRAMASKEIAGKISALDASVTKILNGGSGRIVGATISNGNTPSPMSTIIGGTESDPKKAYAAFREKVKPFESDPTPLHSRIQAITHHIADAGDPDAAFSYMQHQMKAIQYLQSQMPKTQMNPALFYNREYRPSAAEMKNLSDACEAAQDPFYIVRKIENGTLSQKHLDHVKALFPEIHNLIQERVRSMGYEHQMKSGQPNLPYDARLRFQLLTGALGDASLTKEKVASLQQNFQTQSANDNGNAQAGKGFAKTSQAAATPAQRLGLK